MCQGFVTETVSILLLHGEINMDLDCRGKGIERIPQDGPVAVLRWDAGFGWQLFTAKAAAGFQLVANSS